MTSGPPAGLALAAGLVNQQLQIRSLVGKRRPGGPTGSEVVMIAMGFVMLVGLLAVGVVLLAVARAASMEYERTVRRLREPISETLVYEVPNGQDSVPLTIALRQAGFTAVEDFADGVRVVLVECPHGRVGDRPRVRAVIEQFLSPALTRPGEEVRFADEL
jgi:hypothetical protein